eukprot:gene26817-4410_t
MLPLSLLKTAQGHKRSGYAPSRLNTAITAPCRPEREPRWAPPLGGVEDSCSQVIGRPRLRTVLWFDLSWAGPCSRPSHSFAQLPGPLLDGRAVRCGRPPATHSLADRSFRVSPSTHDNLGLVRHLQTGISDLSWSRAAPAQPRLVELKNGGTYNGHLVLCDTWMNMHLREVICTSKDGDKFFRMPEAYLRGNTIKYIRRSDLRAEAEVVAAGVGLLAEVEVETAEDEVETAEGEVETAEGEVEKAGGEGTTEAEEGEDEEMAEDEGREEDEVMIFELGSSYMGIGPIMVGGRGGEGTMEAAEGEDEERAEYEGREEDEVAAEEGEADCAADNPTFRAPEVCATPLDFIGLTAGGHACFLLN